jgi:hypothetical protein
MAAVDVTAVNALTAKASTLTNKGQFARAAEWYAKAITAAEALGQRDCLAVAYLQTLQADALLSVGEGPGAAGALSAAGASAYFATRRRVFVDLLPAPLATLQRRHAAGTLRRGACLPHEQAVFAAKCECQARSLGVQPSALLERTWQLGAEHVGYEAFLTVARLALEVFACSADTFFAMPHAALHAACTCVVDGVALLEQGREGYDSATESSFVRNLQILAGERFKASNPWHVRIMSVWRRVEGSGVLQRRGGVMMTTGIQVIDVSPHNAAHAAHAHEMALVCSAQRSGAGAGGGVNATHGFAAAGTCARSNTTPHMVQLVDDGDVRCAAVLATGGTSDSHPTTIRRHKRRAPGPTSPHGAL